MHAYGISADRTQSRSQRLALCAAALLCALIAAPIAAQHVAAQARTSSIAPELAATLERRGDLTLRETTLADALLTISESWQVNIVVGSEVEGKVNGSFRDAPLHEILDSILQANGFAFRPVGRSLVIYRRGEDAALSPLFMSATIPLGISKPEEIVEGARLLASPQGRVQAIPSANSLAVFDFPQNIAAIRAFVAQLDVAARQSAADNASGAADMQSADFAPQFIDVKSVKEVVQSLLSKDGKVGVMELENRLVVLDYPAHLKLVRDTIARIDVPRPQVRITALIYDLSIEDMERLGINWKQANTWNSAADGAPLGMLAVDSIMQLPAPATTPSSTMTLLNLSQHIDLKCVVDALRQVTNARLLADPTVTVVDRESATIQIVTEIPYQQLTQTGQGGSIGTTAFREAGVTLTVLPKISHDGTLQLQVTPTFSRLAGFTQGESPAPIIDKREAKTTVRVVNGQTLVIGGLRQRGDTRERRGVPYLSDMKYIGPLFRARDDSIRESELVVFITPEILMPCQPLVRPREDAAQFKTRDLLERIPVAPDLEWPNCGEMSMYEGVHVGAPGPYLMEPIPAGMIEGSIEGGGRTDELYIPPTADELPLTPTTSRSPSRVRATPATARPTSPAANRPVSPPPATRTARPSPRTWIDNLFR